MSTWVTVLLVWFQITKAVLTAVSAWATTTLPWFQIGGTIFTAVAAVAAAFSARAALQTAGKADETSRRALEALGRGLRPEQIDIGVWPGNRDPQDYKTPDQWPGPLRIRVFNRGPFTAEKVTVALTDATGKPWPVMRPVAVAGDTHRDLDLPDFTPTCPPAHPSNKDEVQCSAQHHLVVEYSDSRELLRWRLRFPVVELSVLRLDVNPPIPQWVFKPMRQAVGQPELLASPG